MEKYYKVSDVNALVEKLLREPYYQHNDESWYSGVSAMADALLLITPTFIEEPKEGKWELKEEEAFWIQNMEESLKTGKPTKAMMPVCSYCKTEFGTAVLTYRYCPNCGAKMKKEDEDE